MANVEVDGNSENVYAVIRYVEAPNMHVGKHTVQDYNDYVTATHKANMGRNSGWDRYIDFHLGRCHSTSPEGSGCSDACLSLYRQQCHHCFSAHPLRHRHLRHEHW